MPGLHSSCEIRAVQEEPMMIEQVVRDTPDRFVRREEPPPGTRRPPVPAAFCAAGSDFYADAIGMLN